MLSCECPSLSWHSDIAPVLSIDAHPHCDRLASGGQDNAVRVWQFSSSAIVFVSSLVGHSGAVNVVRWSPDGETIASGSDDGALILWRFASACVGDDDGATERWLRRGTLRGHKAEVYAADFSSRGHIVSGSIDGAIIVWDSDSGAELCRISAHSGYVQGIAVDPRSDVIASLATDRQLKLFALTAADKRKFTLKAVKPIRTRKADGGDGAVAHSFSDATLTTFFRRLDWTPDGTFLIAPTGISGAAHGAYVFHRDDLSAPVAFLPTPQPPILIRCSPLRYVRDVSGADDADPICSLPYRLVYAVVTARQCALYVSDRRFAVALIELNCLAATTDVTFGADGRTIFISSADGFVNVIRTAPTLFGHVWSAPADGADRRCK